MLELMAFYAVRGVPLDVLAAATPAERGFLQAAVARTLTGGGRHGE